MPEIGAENRYLAHILIMFLCFAFMFWLMCFLLLYCISCVFNKYFKVTPLFDAEYLRNGTR